MPIYIAGGSDGLDFYEEGTWTPTIAAWTGTITTVGTCAGLYTRIGDQVHIHGEVNITTNGTGSGNGVKMSGMPFNADMSDPDMWYEGVGRENSITGDMVHIHAWIPATFLIASYSGTYPGGDGRRFFFSMTYKA